MNKSNVFRFPQVSLLILFTVLAGFWTLSQNEGEFTASEMKFYCLFVVGVLFLQILGVGLLAWLKQSVLSKGLATVFAAFNIYTLVLVHNARFSGLGEPLWTLFIIGLTLCFAIPFFIRQENFLKFIHISSVIFILISAVDFLGNFKDAFRDSFHSLPENFTAVDFKQKPNVYLISFDAMVPEAIAKNIIGIKDVAYVTAFEKANVRFIPNTFADVIPTQFSLNALMAMDMAYYDKIENKRSFIRNAVPTPGYEIFRHNGYKLQFMFSNTYFGGGVDNLDYYGIARKDGLCQHAIKPYSFMGFCLPVTQDFIATLIDTKNYPYPEMLFDRIKKTAAMDEPWLTYAYIYEPGHAKNSFNPHKDSDWEEYRTQLAKNVKTAARLFEELMAIINKHDPEAITLIFGDHGAMTSKGLLNDASRMLIDSRTYEGPKPLSKDTPLTYEQVVQDRHAVINAIYPADVCSDNFKQNPFSLVRTVRELAKCLSGGQDPLPADYQPNDEVWRDYMYE